MIIYLRIINKTFYQIRPKGPCKDQVMFLHFTDLSTRAVENPMGLGKNRSTNHKLSKGGPDKVHNTDPTTVVTNAPTLHESPKRQGTIDFLYKKFTKYRSKPGLPPQPQPVRRSEHESRASRTHA